MLRWTLFFFLLQHTHLKSLPEPLSIRTVLFFFLPFVSSSVFLFLTFCKYLKWQSDARAVTSVCVCVKRFVFGVLLFHNSDLSIYGVKLKQYKHTQVFKRWWDWETEYIWSGDMANDDDRELAGELCRLFASVSSRLFIAWLVRLKFIFIDFGSEQFRTQFIDFWRYEKVGQTFDNQSCFYLEVSDATILRPPLPGAIERSKFFTLLRFLE